MCAAIEIEIPIAKIATKNKTHHAAVSLALCDVMKEDDIMKSDRALSDPSVRRRLRAPYQKRAQ